MRISPIVRSAVIKPQPKAQFRILALPLARLPRTARPPAPAASASAAAATSTPSGSTPAAASASSTSTQDAISDTALPTGTLPPPPAPLMLFHISQPPATSPAVSGTTDPKEAAKRLPYHQQAINKASDYWLGLKAKPEGSWMRWFYDKGEGLMDKIEYEEWALKSVQEGVGVKVGKDGKIADADRIEVPLLRPTLKENPLPPLLPKLHRHLIHRIPYHKKMMRRSVFAIPLTWPFAIIPVLPNFPMFYVIWRAWSHYKAWRGAVYLEQLLQAGLIVEKSDKRLDDVYAARAQLTRAEGAEDHAPDETRGGTVTSTKQLAGAPGEAPRDERRNTKEAEGLPDQAKGKEGSVDGTATPDSMVFKGRADSATSTSTSTSASTAPQQEGQAPKKAAPRLHHPSLLIAPSQVPVLVREFNLRQAEEIDVNRAVEQAVLRLVKADEKAASGKA